MCLVMAYSLIEIAYSSWVVCVRGCVFVTDILALRTDIKRKQVLLYKNVFLHANLADMPRIQDLKQFLFTSRLLQAIQNTAQIAH